MSCELSRIVDSALFHIVQELGEIMGHDAFFCVSVNYVAMIRQ